MIDAFSGFQWSWLLSGLLLVVAAILFFHRGKTTLSLITLSVAAFVLRLLMTHTDPFLYVWDEQYHALVAQHLAAHPGTPTLYDDPQLPVDITMWAHNHIWLHKPPLFLWLIAASIKMFGATPFAVKLPSAILSALMVPALYSIVRRIASERAGFIAAVLLAAHSCSIQLVSGFKNTDHNDIIFSAFILFSFWAWIRYTDSERKRDAILVGLLVGCAILVKFLPGILVFGPWGLWLLQKSNRKDKKKWIHWSIAVVSTAALVLPWYYHIYKNFPAEAAYESYYNWMHLKIPMEGHEGPWYYQFDQVRELLGWTFAILTIPGILLFAVQDTKQKRALYIVAAVFVVVAFYSWAPTKMPLFLLPVIPFLLGGIAVMIDKAGDAMLKKKLVSALTISAIAVFVLDVPAIVTNHSSLSEVAWYRDEMLGTRNKAEFYLKQKQESGETRRGVIFNFPENERTAFMFYTGDIAYTKTPSLDTLHMIAKKGFAVSVYENHLMPEEYKSDSTLRLYFGHLSPPAQ
jgi:4-amino-4-deoxy-L-arabinose transferase-like glycosyltransferase